MQPVQSGESPRPNSRLFRLVVWSHFIWFKWINVGISRVELMVSTIWLPFRFNRYIAFYLWRLKRRFWDFVNQTICDNFLKSLFSTIIHWTVNYVRLVSQIQFVGIVCCLLYKTHNNKSSISCDRFLFYYFWWATFEWTIGLNKVDFRMNFVQFKLNKHNEIIEFYNRTKRIVYRPASNESSCHNKIGIETVNANVPQFKAKLKRWLSKLIFFVERWCAQS